MSQLTETEINIRKQTLEADEAKVKETLVKLENEKQNLMAQQFAINGAIQQCDLFLKDLAEGEVVSETTDSSIPKDKKG